MARNTLLAGTFGYLCRPQDETEQPKTNESCRSAKRGKRSKLRKARKPWPNTASRQTTYEAGWLS